MPRAPREHSTARVSPDDSWHARREPTSSAKRHYSGVRSAPSGASVTRSALRPQVGDLEGFLDAPKWSSGVRAPDLWSMFGRQPVW